MKTPFSSFAIKWQKCGMCTLLYSVLLFSAGLMGFLRKNSLISLSVGGIFGLALLWMSALIFSKRKEGLYGAFILVSLLSLVFAVRFAKGRQFFPSGLLLLLSVSMGVFLKPYLQSFKKWVKREE